MTQAAKEKSIYGDYKGAPDANDTVQTRNMELNDGRRSRGNLEQGDATSPDDAQVRATDREMGTHLDMGTENDMEELQEGNSRDPGAKKTLSDDEPMEKRY